MIKIKRVYEEPSERDGIRILVDRIWPRGMSKDRAKITEWRKDLAPSDALRQWFKHDPAKWEKFCERYCAELSHPELLTALKALARQARRQTLTLVYSAADEEHNQAVALKKFLKQLQ